MPIQRTSVDAFLNDGCGRCDKYATPDCKVLLWPRPLVALRALVRGAGLEETLKWGSPCYTADGRNVVMVVAFKDYCGLEFFRGAELSDPQGLLQAHGEHSRSGRGLRFTSEQEVRARRGEIERLLGEAIALERAGKKPRAAPAVEALPEELAELLASRPAVAKAFEALTPGRRRSHALHVGGAKQSATRASRAEKCAEVILQGRGFNER